jgi:GNAT superfamily N-acetyltransferase
MEPRCISSTLAGKPIPKGATQTTPTKAKPEYAAEYSAFLHRYFYPSSAPVQLAIPPTTLSVLLESQIVIGAEIRNSDKQLVGCVFDIYAGNILGQTTGLVTWFCIHPSWRKKGIGSVLLFALYSFSQPRKIHWWRNDASLQSPLPPIWSEEHLVRPKYGIRTDILSPIQLQLFRSSLQSWKQGFKETWLKKNPAGLVLENPAETGNLATVGAASFPNGNTANIPNLFIQEVWEAKFSKTRFAAILIQPTYEIQQSPGATSASFSDRIQRESHSQSNKKRYCEIIAYAWKDPPRTEYEQAVLLEKMLDQLPYDLLEIGISFPHLDQGWTSVGQTSWTSIGLDPGIPVQRPILPLYCA